MNAQILNKYIELIDKGYCDDCNELNCLGNFPHKDIAKNIKVILEENQELKNLNRIYEEIISDDKENYKLLSSEIKQLGNQQKEFIEYITSYIELLNDKPDLVELSQKDILEEILSKYKEIIGGDNKC